MFGYNKNKVFQKDIAKNANEFNFFDFTFGINEHTLKIKFIKDHITDKFTFVIYDVTDPNAIKLFAFSQETFITSVKARTTAMNYLNKNFENLYEYFKKLKK